MTAKLFRVVFALLCALNLIAAISLQEQGKRWTFHFCVAMCCFGQYLLSAGME